MTDDSIVLRELLEKSADADLLREMILVNDGSNLTGPLPEIRFNRPLLVVPFPAARRWPKLPVPTGSATALTAYVLEAAMKMSNDWAVQLSGDNWSLEGLGGWFTQDRCKVSRGADGSYSLTSPDLTACRTEDEAWAVAERLVSHINSAAKVIEPSNAPVLIGALADIAPDGTVRRLMRASIGSVAAVARARAYAVIIRGGQTVEEPSGPSLAERMVLLQEREGPDSAVARALAQWNLPEQTPTSLNNILEVIRDDASGGGDRNTGRAWETMTRTIAPLMNKQEAQLDNELRRCRDSLHDPTSVGALARHGSPRHVANAMNLREAKAFVYRVLLAWLHGKV